MLIETVNLHVWGRCNLKCVYCYGSFPEDPRSLPLATWKCILLELAAHDVRRVTFSGGEPTLHPSLLEMMSYAKGLGLQVSIITNGTRLTDPMLEVLDVVGITLDAVSEPLLREMGRGLPRGWSYVQHTMDVAQRARAHGAYVKVNTVVTTMNASEQLSAVLLELRPDKWKPMQFTEVLGENDGAAPRLRVTEKIFQEFVDRHAAVGAAGIWVQPESESTIRGTYVMVDPTGRIFQHTGAAHRLSEPVQEVGFERALAQTGGYDREAFVARGGHVDVRRLPVLNRRDT